MKRKFLAILCIIFIAASVATSQTVRPVVVTDSTSAAAKYEVEMQQKDARIAADIREGNQRTYGLSGRNVNEHYFPGFIYSRPGARFFIRRLSKKDRELISILPGDKNTYADILKQENTGIVRLQDHGRCENSKFVVTINCTWNVIGNAGAFSFRKKKYSNFEYADVVFRKSGFENHAFNRLGLIANLGDIPLSDISINNSAVGTLKDFIAPQSKLDLEKQLVAARSGFMIGKNRYSARHLMSPNSTFLIRSIAYNFEKNSKSSKMLKMRYGKDNRADVIAAFRIIREHDDGSVTIIWKRLQKKKAPKITK